MKWKPELKTLGITLDELVTSAFGRTLWYLIGLRSLEQIEVKIIKDQPISNCYTFGVIRK